MKTSPQNESCVETLADAPNVAALVKEKIEELDAQGCDEAFFIADLGDVVGKFVKWKELLPRVEPFYAVKCNQDETVVKLLAELGMGFDCASKAEISQVVKMGVSPSRIIYANPCKQKSFLKYAHKQSVDLMTFDNEAELIKIKALYPSARLVLRLLPTSHFKVQCELGNKFGCHPDNVGKLLAQAQELDLNVMGISFHVGSGVEEAAAFSCAVKQAYEAWNMAQAYGFEMTLLDIGGGFPGQKSAPITFEEIASVLNQALDMYFPKGSGVRIIAEPGRYFVASAFTLAVNIIAKRTVARDISDNGGASVDGHHQQNVTRNDEPSHMYYVNDGVYGSFNSLMYDHAQVEASVLEDPDAPQFSSSVWGPTCDGLDCILEDCHLPEMEVGQWMYFRDMGAYTMCAGSTFNGMPRPACFYFCRSSVWREVNGEPVAKRRCESLSADGQFPAVLKAGMDFQSLHDAVCSIPVAPEENMLA
ncbi:ornithine decarboxylase [Aplysia californica]|uniref:ornithine decarboxylase n=1 Tax=Aplysia californica TaxID=6500 RepID=A0ABM0JJQ0_APLCA|nr:ornithine decarboxylase [Aplysia californica]